MNYEDSTCNIKQVVANWVFVWASLNRPPVLNKENNNILLGNQIKCTCFCQWFNLIYGLGIECILIYSQVQVHCYLHLSKLYLLYKFPFKQSV